MTESNDSQCQQDHVWDNWAGTIQFQSTCYFEPITLGDLTQILGQAQANGKKVRAVGSGHSWSLGAVPGDAPYVPNGAVDAYLINVSNMNPTNCGQDPYLKAFYFKDSAGANYVAVPPGTSQGWISDNAANINDQTHQCSNQHDNLALGSMGPAPDITLGGFIANGCHGTGWEQPTVADLVYGIEIMTVDAAGGVVTKAYAVNQELADLLGQNQVTKATPEAAPDKMRALRVGLGALGVITKLVFRLEPLFNVAHLDEYADVDLIFPQDGDTTNLETLVTSCDYIEIFWFPFTSQVWVKRYSRTDAPVERSRQVVDFVWITSELASLTHGMLGKLFQLFPSSTPLVLKVFFEFLKLFMSERELKAVDFNQDFDPASDPVVPVNEAYLYQTKYFTDLLDLSYTVPIPRKQGGAAGYDFSKAMTAWNDAVNTIYSMEQDGKYPVSLNVHLRFVKNSDSLLSPANHSDAAAHTCYIEFLSFSEQLDPFIPYSAAVGKDWASLGGLPHWAKIFQLVPDAYQLSHQHLQDKGLLQPFLDLRGELDPGDVFMNDFLNQLLNGAAAGAEKKVTLRQPLAAASASASNVSRQFRLPHPRALEGFAIGKVTALQTSERGCYLVHDPGGNLAMLFDEHGTSNLLQYEVGPARDLVTYRPLASSKFLSPSEILARVGEVLKASAAPASA